MKCPACGSLMYIADTDTSFINSIYTVYTEYNCSAHKSSFGDRVRNAITIDNNENIRAYMIELNNNIIIFGSDKYGRKELTEIYDTFHHKSLVLINKFIKINNPESIDEFNNIYNKLNNLKVFS